jgi:hypothetical protein
LSSLRGKIPTKSGGLDCLQSVAMSNVLVCWECNLSMASWSFPLVNNLGEGVVYTPDAEIVRKTVFSRLSFFPTRGTCLLPSATIVHSPTGNNLEPVWSQFTIKSRGIPFS